MIGLLLLATWHAGQESAQLDEQRLRAELNHLRETVASTQLQLDHERAKAETVDRPAKTSMSQAASELQTTLRQQLLKAQAEANQYKAILEREQQSYVNNSRLLRALSSPGAHLLPMKGLETAADSTAYALVVENSRVVFVASNLPKLPSGRQFQLWLVRKQDPKIVSAGLFISDDTNKAMMEFDDGSVVSDISILEVTDEPEGGSETPTGNKILETGVSPTSE